MIWILIQKWPNIIWYSAECYSIFASRVTYSLCLLFDLDTRASVITLTANLEAGPPFAKIWKPLSCRESTLRLLLSFLELFYDFNVHPIWLKDSTFLALPQVHPDPQWNLQKDLDFRFKRIYSWFNKYQVFYYEKIVILLNLTECKMLAWLDSVKYLHD